MGRLFSVLAIMALTALPLVGQAPAQGQGQGRQGGGAPPAGGGQGAGRGPQMPMGFFITSTPLDGANLGGLAGADKHCQTLAAAVGAGNREWRA